MLASSSIHWCKGFLLVADFHDPAHIETLRAQKLGGGNTEVPERNTEYGNTDGVETRGNNTEYGNTRRGGEILV
eukprot:7226406-Prymnesium_polylepis.1